MEITEVRIKLVEKTAERLMAFCSITIDGAFVIRDLKLIGGPHGLFVAMPSRKLCAHCRKCSSKNPLKASFCNTCGHQMQSQYLPCDKDGRVRLYADIAHPINTECRELIQDRVMAEYEAELIRAQKPGYASRYEDLGDE
ncbi:MAG: SpoVG family protein [Pirellulales bacterium]|nr:SpoVG family protein [Pirellulales bacterium]